jgi:aryl-alcohol dehydrogenase-like predicted oxidoreductase
MAENARLRVPLPLSFFPRDPVARRRRGVEGALDVGGFLRRLTEVDPARLAIAGEVATVAAGLGLSPAVVALAWLRAQGGIIPILGARTAQRLADNLTFLDVELPAGPLARLDQVSRVRRGFPHDFLAGTDHTFGGMSAQLDLPPGRTRYG